MTQPSAARYLATGASQAHILARLSLIGDRVDALVAAGARAPGDQPDALRALYTTAATIDALLSRPATPVLPEDEILRSVTEIEEQASAAAEAGEDLRLRRLAGAFGLTLLESEILLIALAPDLDARFERYYGFLNDDVTQRRATAQLVMDLLGKLPTDVDVRRSTGHESRLVREGLLLVDDPDRPFLSRSLRVPDGVTAFLLGEPHTDPEVAALSLPPPTETGDPATLTRALIAGVGLAYLQERPATSARGFAARALRGAGLATLSLDLARWGAVRDVAALTPALIRQARLHHAGIVAGPVDSLLPDHRDWLRTLAELPVPVILLGTEDFDPQWTTRVPLLVEATVPDEQDRQRAWRSVLGEALPDGLDPLAETVQFQLGTEGIRRAARYAALHAVAGGHPVDGDALRAGARVQDITGLDRLVRRIRPGVGPSDLVLADHTRRELDELADRARFRDRVLRQQRLRPGGGFGTGVSALFTGTPGTGKTMSAEVLAGELGMDLFVLNLAATVDKYIGETEKKLERVFDEPAIVNGVLLFDEADALFGKRSEVRDAHDRYANVEVSYLLQRLEGFDGVAILTTNLRANIDEAFTRRLDCIIEFQRPNETERRHLWEVALRPLLSASAKVDLDWCAANFDLSGGEIRSTAITSAYLAAAEDVPLGMSHIARALDREFHKNRRLLSRASLQPYGPPDGQDARA